MTTGGWVFIGFTLLVGLGAHISQNNLLYLVLGVSLSCILFSGFYSGAMLMAVRVRREPIAAMEAGRTSCVRFSVTSRAKWFPGFALLIREAKTGESHGWERTLPPVRAVLDHLPPGQTRIVSAPITPTHRGRWRIDTIEMSSGFPFGMMSKTIRVSAPERFLVRPRTVAVSIQLPHSDARGASDGTGLAWERAASGDFLALREYVAGDPIRLVSWKASARLGEPVVTQLDEPTQRRVVIELDPLGPPGAGADGRELAIARAGSIARVLVERGFDVGLSVPTHSVHLPTAGGRPHVGRLLDTLAALDLGNPRPSRNPPAVPSDAIVLSVSPCNADSMDAEAIASVQGVPA